MLSIEQNSIRTDLMMNQTTQNWIMYLTLFAGALIILLIGVFYASSRRKKNELQSQERETGNQLAEPQETTFLRQPEPARQPEPLRMPGRDQKLDDRKAEPERDLKTALAKTENQIFGRLRNLFRDQGADQVWDQIEEILYTSDIGPATVEEILAAVKRDLGRSERKDFDSVQRAMKKKFEDIFRQNAEALPKSAEALQKNDLNDTASNEKSGRNADKNSDRNSDPNSDTKSDPKSIVPFDLVAQVRAASKPQVIMVVGVNGVGKTTTIGKLAAHFAQGQMKVLVAAGDTFRAAASEQLKVWSDRAEVEIFSPENVKDPSAVAFDAVAKAKAQGIDVVIIDTAGRLHTQLNLMEELKKVKRVIQKLVPDAPHETLIVLDANSGQNALIQAKQFHESVGLTGAVITKMDGTAKGGVAIGLVSEVKIPVRYIGIGESIKDLRAFDSKSFVNSLLGI